MQPSGYMQHTCIERVRQKVGVCRWDAYDGNRFPLAAEIDGVDDAD
jgi:hypothetical protein